MKAEQILKPPYRRISPGIPSIFAGNDDQSNSRPWRRPVLCSGSLALRACFRQSSPVSSSYSAVDHATGTTGSWKQNWTTKSCDLLLGAEHLACSIAKGLIIRSTNSPRPNNRPERKRRAKTSVEQTARDRGSHPRDTALHRGDFPRRTGAK